MKVPPLHRDSNKCALDGAILRRGGHPRATLSSKMRRGGACVPARTSTQRRFHTKNTRIVRREFNDGCALVGRHGRAHRHRPYQPPPYFSTQSHTNEITIYAQSPNDTNRLRVIHPNETVGAAPVCPPERPRSGVSIPKIHALCAGDERWMRPCRATRPGT